MEENIFTTINDDGAEIKYKILFTFEDPETSKNYIIYTDDISDEEGNTRVFASTFNPNEENQTLSPIETDEEWDKIEAILEELQDNDGF